MRRSIKRSGDKKALELKKLREEHAKKCASAGEQTGFFNIEGVERTQAIQVFRWSGPCTAFSAQEAPAQKCRDNAIPMISGKSTALRAYISVSGSAPEDLKLLDGKLEFIAPNGHKVPSAPVIRSFNGPLPKQNLNGVNRGITDASLNFHIPPHLARGSLNVRITVYDADKPSDSGRAKVYEEKIPFSPLRLPLRGYRVRFSTSAAWGVTQPIIASTSAFYHSFDFVRKVFPAQVELTGFEILDLNPDEAESLVTDASGTRRLRVPPHDPRLFSWVGDRAAAARKHTGEWESFFAEVPWPGTVGPSDTGSASGTLPACAGFGSAAGLLTMPRGPRLMSHELAHVLGIGAHSNEAGSGFPASSTGPQGSLLSVGFDPETMQVVPSNTSDILVSGPVSVTWPSTYTYENMRVCLEDIMSRKREQFLVQP